MLSARVKKKTKKRYVKHLHNMPTLVGKTCLEMARLPIKKVCFLSTQTQLEIVPSFFLKISCRLMFTNVETLA